MVVGTVTSATRVGAGEWEVVVGDRFIAVLAAPADDRAIAELAGLTGDATVGIERLVQEIPGAPDAAGEVDRGFAVVWWPTADASSVTAVVRGEAVVDVDSPGGSRRFDGRGIRPWHLAEFRDVSGVRITEAAAPLRPRGTAIGARAPGRATLRATDVEWTPEARPSGADVPLGASSDRAARGGPLDATNAPETETATDAIAITGEEPETVEGPADLDPISAFAPGPPPRVRIGADDVRTVTRPILVGRRPLAPRAPAAASAAPELVPVRSPTGVVSGTHLELRVEGERLVATDLRSTNGTVLRTATGVRRMRAGESIVVVPGSTLDLGDDTIIEVLPASDEAPRPTRTDRPRT
ncbi:FHA domain-containing protein [Agromyces aureus]|uniref:FHA domain-containing protein n=1 Tax=Agromyces aureus TaxID=453304 RepID=A0A191WHB0_9MICO|nr:FHA domain-containing protein [Agromyces aureus]ANJ27569.1 hypothetical protein ATC03_13465 [Agromyces aureus]